MGCEERLKNAIERTDGRQMTRWNGGRPVGKVPCTNEPPNAGFALGQRLCIGNEGISTAIKI